MIIAEVTVWDVIGIIKKLESLRNKIIWNINAIKLLYSIYFYLKKEKIDPNDIYEIDYYVIRKTKHVNCRCEYKEGN